MPSVSDSVGQGQGLKMCISNKFSGVAGAVGSETTLRTTALTADKATVCCSTMVPSGNRDLGMNSFKGAHRNMPEKWKGLFSLRH